MTAPAARARRAALRNQRTIHEKSQKSLRPGGAGQKTPAKKKKRREAGLGVLKG